MNQLTDVVPVHRVEQQPSSRTRTVAGLVDYDCARSSEHEGKRTDKFCTALFYGNNRQAPVRVSFCSSCTNDQTI